MTSLNMAVIISLTIYMYPSANNSCKQIGPRPGQMFVGPDLDPNCLILKLRFVQQKISPIHELSVLSGAKLCFVSILTFMLSLMHELLTDIVKMPFLLRQPSFL